MEVSIALCIGISEITHEAFRNMVMTFESVPKWHRLVPTNSIVKKGRSLARAPWGGSTNFVGAYELILKVCMDSKLSREDMPSIIVFSDMQFNAAAGLGGNHWLKMQGVLDNIKARVAPVATSLGWSDMEPAPIVFWNLRNSGGHPVNKTSEGAVLLSGFSPSLLKLVMNCEALQEEEIEVVQSDGTVTTEKIRVSPEQVLRKMLDDDLYAPVRAILPASNEGALVEYISLEKELADTTIANNDKDEEFMIVE